VANLTSKTSEQRLLDNFDTYDQHVDVVSAFEWIFTEPTVEKLSETVQHFERFPHVKSASGVTLTPDFTVLFQDGTGIVGEIAKISLREESVDGLCSQIGKYAEVKCLPDRTGRSIDVTHIDVMQIVEMKTGLAALQRIISDRYLIPEHPFKPPEPPCLVQFSRSDTVYSFQRIPAPSNGTLCSEGRDPHIQHYLDKGFNPRISGFAKVKVKRGFINDQIDSLYLATHLWTRTWPTVYGAGTNDISVDINETASYIRAQYGVVRGKDIKRAIELLGQVGLAAKEHNGAWTVSRKQLGRSNNRDVHRLIAARFSGTPRKLVSRRPRQDTITTTGTLF
jgi:hypothetical protein